MSLRRSVHSLLDGEPPTAIARLLRSALAALIVINVVAIVLDSVPEIGTRWREWFDRLEWLSVGVFSAEYAARLWTAPEWPRFRAPVAGRLRWMLTPAAVIDLLSILPSLLVFLDFDLRVLRIVRLSRLLRVARLGRYSIAVKTLQHVLRSKATDLITLVVMLAVVLVVSSAAMYQIENEAQPQTFSSIPATMWWGIVTLTTIGYGDMVPVTAMGRVLGGCMTVLGIGMFALPAGLLGAAFVDELTKARKAHADRGAPSTQGNEPAKCPHCGGSLH